MMGWTSPPAAADGVVPFCRGFSRARQGSLRSLALTGSIRGDGCQPKLTRKFCTFSLLQRARIGTIEHMFPALSKAIDELDVPVDGAAIVALFADIDRLHAIAAE